MGFWRNLSLAAACAALAAPAAAQYQGPRPYTPAQKAAAEAELARFTSPRLTRFQSEEEFRRYLGAVLSAGRAHGQYWAASGAIQFAQAGQSDSVQPICPPEDPNCAVPPPSENNADEAIAVTGSRISARGRAAAPARAMTSQASRPSNGDI